MQNSIVKSTEIQPLVPLKNHNEVNLVVFGFGSIGKKFIDLWHRQLNKTIHNHTVNIVAIFNSKKVRFNPAGLSFDEIQYLIQNGQRYNLNNIIQKIASSNIPNICIVDLTASDTLPDNYEKFFNHNWHVVTANKAFDSQNNKSYQKSVSRLIDNDVYLLNECTVGAGIPIIATIKNLINAKDPIRKIEGVFSGSLSYIFNTYSHSNQSFTSVVTQAQNMGLTEPNPMVDLSGSDILKKMVILARVSKHNLEIEDIQQEKLIPDVFSESLHRLGFNDDYHPINFYFFRNIQANLKKDEVLRYVASIDFDLQKYILQLRRVKKESELGMLKHSENLFQVYTDSYSTTPLTLKGPGAGTQVTAQGAWQDIARLIKRI